MKYFLHTQNLLNSPSSYNPKIYVNSSFTPPLADTLTENLLSDFKEAIVLYATNQLSQTKPNHNLTKLQRKILLQLKQNKNITICLSDKNLGPVLIDTTQYIHLAIDNHLSNSNVYDNLPSTTALHLLSTTKNSLLHLFSTYKHLFSDSDRTYFSRSFLKPTRTPIFYQLIKIHKMNSQSSNIPTRPVISCINSFAEIFSKFCDVLLEKLAIYVPSKLSDSFQVLHELHSISSPLPNNAKLITADAISMYTNINPTHAKFILKQWVSSFSHELPANFPSTFLIEAVDIIMTKNIFKFGNTHYLQKKGLAMGTSCAVMLSTVYYGFHERTVLKPKYGHLFIYFKRFVDDLIFVSKRTLTQLEFSSLSSDLSFGDLNWTINEQTTTHTFLDLDISIINNKFYFKTHIKKLNLHLYIPPHSCHPSHCLKSLIYGMLFRFYLQNTKNEDYKLFTTNFFNQLLARGHNYDHLSNLFLQSSKLLDQKLQTNKNINPYYLKTLSNIQNNKKTNNNNDLFYHSTFHPQNIPSTLIQNTFHHTLASLSYINNLIICNHRPKNLRDKLIPTNIFPSQK